MTPEETARQCVAEWYKMSNHDPLESGNLDALTTCIANEVRHLRAAQMNDERLNELEQTYSKMNNGFASSGLELIAEVRSLRADNARARELLSGVRIYLDAADHSHTLYEIDAYLAERAQEKA